MNEQNGLLIKNIDIDGVNIKMLVFSTSCAQCCYNLINSNITKIIHRI